MFDNDFSEEDFVDCYKRNITIKEWLKEKWTNKLQFDYSDDDFSYLDLGRECHPERWLKCKVQVKCMR